MVLVDQTIHLPLQAVGKKNRGLHDAGTEASRASLGSLHV